jgi:hypothetical protein
MKTILRVLILTVLLSTVLSCEKESADSLSLLDSAKQEYAFLKNTQASNEANQLRSTSYSAAFEITKVERNKDQLNITVTYPNDCSDSRFEVIWNGLVMESYPEIVIFYIRRLSDCKTSGTTASRVLSINLTEKLGDAALAQRTKVLLCNASKKANTENSDISASGN